MAAKMLEISGNVKSGLKKTIGKNSLSRKALEITLVEVESTVNSRPITFVSDKFLSKLFENGNCKKADGRGRDRSVKDRLVGYWP
jgi:hypothetical protein